MLAHRQQLLVVHHVGGHAGARQTGADGIYADAFLAQVERQCSREIHDGALRGVVGAHRPIATRSGHRRGIHDRAFRLQEMRNGGAAAEEDAVGVGRHDLAPLLVRELGGIAAFVNARIVHQHVEPAETLHGRSDQVVDGLRIRHVGDKGERTVRRKLAGDLFERLALAVDQGDLGPFGREATRRRLADAAPVTTLSSKRSFMFES